MKAILRKLIPLRSPFRVTYHYLRGMIAYWTSGKPAKDMIVIGVTGTKGKTTTCNLILDGLEAAGHTVALFSTATVSIAGQKQENNTKMTSSDPFKMWEFIRKAKQAGCKYLIVETSSHALYFHRVHGLHYDMAILTNISQDHLDLHGTMENYVNTKLLLFKRLYQYGIHKGVRKIGVVNIDSPYADVFTSKDVVFDNLYTVGLNEQASIRAENISSQMGKLEFDVAMPSERFHLSTSLYGEFNVYNILCAISVLISEHVSQDIIKKVVADFDTVPGRLEEVKNTRGVRIFVDYAHTVDSLKNVIQTVKNIEGTNRVFVVFGATGDRDATKRPLMGKIVDEMADVCILTDDDTYTEDSLKIIREVAEGINRKEGENFWIIPSREDAIRTALLMLKKNDALIVAGKGSESVQVTQRGPIPWNDKKAIQEILSVIDQQVILSA
ncbi:UDP-N-acetylmuramoyl-L-alanyl-D-glutamate--2,6-diaminopimelate ligase [Candidatus Gracilibacteria bacterium]|nr:UDP-N-acetylmuramoyl-L-alanyl-D-glutamate--2,6-diaminopimelate ligase [Candidatus Gracilibacteria bacterium]